MLVWEDDVRLPSTTPSNMIKPEAPTASRVMELSPSVPAAQMPFPVPAAASQPDRSRTATVPSLTAAVAAKPASAAAPEAAAGRRVNVAEKRIINGQTEIGRAHV